jgi:hypothetical protein
MSLDTVRRSPAGRLVDGLILCGAAALVLAAAVWLCELFEWLWSADWAGLRLVEVLRRSDLIDDTSWRGVQQLWSIFIHLPLWLSLLILSLALLSAGLKGYAVIERSEALAWDRRLEARRRAAAQARVTDAAPATAPPPLRAAAKKGATSAPDVPAASKAAPRRRPKALPDDSDRTA